jgi:hypothetical protein
MKKIKDLRPKNMIGYKTEAQDPKEYDFEGDMAKGDLKVIIKHAQKIHDMLEDNTNLPEWVQSKITKSEDYITTVANYLDTEMNESITEAKHGDYEITHKPYNGPDKHEYVSDDVQYVHTKHQKKLGIEHADEGSDGGVTRHVTVKNTKTGAVSHHAVSHEETFKDRNQKQKIQIRALKKVTPHDKAHMNVIKKHLQNESITTENIQLKKPSNYQDFSYTVGRKAALNKKPISSNPHPKDSEAHKQWSKGHSSVKTEEVEKINEISKATKASYAQKAVSDIFKRGSDMSTAVDKGDSSAADKASKKASKRMATVQNLVHKGLYKKEEVEQLDEKNKPTNPSLWSKAKSLAKQKFDVYPSAYANGWAAKWYKSKGGGWKTMKESRILDIIKEVRKKKDDDSKFQKEPELNSSIRKDNGMIAADNGASGDSTGD